MHELVPECNHMLLGPSCLPHHGIADNGPELCLTPDVQAVRYALLRCVAAAGQEEIHSLAQQSQQHADVLMTLSAAKHVPAYKDFPVRLAEVFFEECTCLTHE